VSVRIKQIQPRVFIHGMEIPAKRIDLYSQLNSPVVGIVSVEAGNYARKIRPSTPIHVLSQDPWEVDSQQEYLVFEGDAYPEGIERGTSGKRFSFRVYDYSYTWNIVPMEFIDFKKGMGAVFQTIRAHHEGRNVSLSSDSLEELFNKSLNVLSDNDPEKFMRAMMYLLVTMAQASPIYNLMNNRFDTFGKVVFDEPTEQFLKVLDRAIIKNSMKIRIDRRAGHQSAWGTVLQLLAEQNYNFVSLLAPSLNRTKGFLKDKGTNEVVADVKKRLVNLAGSDPYVNKIGTYFFKPDLYNCPPPTCNVIFPHQYNNVSQSRSWMTEPTRFSFASAAFQDKSIFPQAKYSMRPLDLLHFMKTFTELSQGRKSKQADFRALRKAALKSMPDTTSFGPWMYFNNEEMMRGIITSQGNPFLAGAYPRNLGKKGFTRFGEATADYEFDRNKTDSRGTQIEGDLNFRPVAGFPSVFLDKKKDGDSFYGMLDAMRCTWDAKGYSGNFYSVNKIRFIDEEDLNLPVTIFSREENGGDDVLRKDEIQPGDSPIILDAETGFPKFHGRNEPVPPKWMTAYSEKDYVGTREKDQNDTTVYKKIIKVEYKARASTKYNHLLGPSVVAMTFLNDPEGAAGIPTDANKWDAVFLARKASEAEQEKTFNRNFDDQAAVSIKKAVNLLEEYIEEVGETDAAYRFIDKYTKRDLIPSVGPERISEAIVQVKDAVTTSEPKKTFEALNGLEWYLDGEVGYILSAMELAANKKIYHGPFNSYSSEAFENFRAEVEEIVFSKFKAYAELAKETSYNYSLITEQTMLDIKRYTVRAFLKDLLKNDIFEI